MKRRALAIGTVCAAIAVVAAAAAAYVLQSPYQYHLNDVTGHQPELKLFRARDTEGQVRTADDYSGETVILYFGYTHCPDVCPTTLAKLHAAMKRLGKETAGRIQVLFVSVDPKRDTRQVLHQYIRAFDPRFEALRLTGDPLQKLEKRYHISVSYGEPDADGNYAVYHSSGIFVFDGRGRMRLIGSGQDPLSDWVPDLRHLAG